MEAWLIAAGFALAWMMSLAVLLSYRMVCIPVRLREVRDAFLGRVPPAQVGASLRHLPAWHYVQLRRPHQPPPKTWEELNAFLTDQFMKYHGWWHYVLPAAMVLAFGALSLVLGYVWVMDRLGSRVLIGLVPGGGAVLMHSAPNTVILALLGAYVWSLYELISRRNSRDLTPDELYEVAHRFVAALPIGYAFSLLGAGAFSPALAFAASAFPVRDAQRILRQRALQRMETQSRDPDCDGHLGTMIDGLSKETVARLEELHIATAYDLGYADPVGLMLRTGFSARHVLAWIDQAMLVIYLRPHRQALAAAGLPCALDICEFFDQNCYDEKNHAIKDWPNAPAVREMAHRLKMTPEMLVAAFEAVYKDPHVRFLDACWYGNGERLMFEVVGVTMVTATSW